VKIKQIILYFLILAATPVSVLAETQIDIVKYEISVELDHEQHMLRGKELIVWHNTTSDIINDMYLHLYWNAFKNEESALISEGNETTIMGRRRGGLGRAADAGWIDITKITTGDGTDISSTMEFVIVDEPRRPGDQTVLRIRFPQPLKPNEWITLNLEFESKIPRTIARSGYYQDGYFIGQWFPKPGVYQQGKGWNCHHYHLSGEFFADFADFTVQITVPKEFVVGASGREIAQIERPENGTTTYIYRQNHIHDFAWTADPDFIKLERLFIPDSLITAEEYEYYSKIHSMPLSQIKLQPVRMILLINPEHAKQAGRHFRALEQAIKYFGLWYGPYTYPTITMVDPPYRTKSSGMEYPTLFTAGTGLFLSDKVQKPERVIFHEFGHNYWYGMSANNEFEEAWLDEGINTYCESKALYAAYGPMRFSFRIGGFPVTRYFSAIEYPPWERARLIGMNSTKSDPLVTNSWQFYDAMSYGMSVYNIATNTLFTLENILGGDTMLRALRTFQTRYRYKHPTTADFIKTINDVSKRDLSWFFDEFFYSANEFDYGLGTVTSKEIKSPRGIFDSDSGKIVIDRAKAAQRDTSKSDQYYSLIKVRRFGEAKLGGDELLEVEMVFEDSSMVTRYWDGQARWKEFRLVTSSKLKSVQIDPQTKYLIDANLANNSYILKGQSGGVLRWSNKLLFWIQNILEIFTLIS